MIDNSPKMPQNKRNMTQSLEDYLEMVSFLADEGEVRVTDIAARLDVSKPSVLTALRSLEEQGLLKHERYGTVSLTKKGTAQASEIRERHDLLNTFLQNIVGVDAKTAERDACKMEHLLSRETLAKMKVLVNGIKPKAPEEAAAPAKTGEKKAPAAKKTPTRRTPAR
jgi:DtxR family Mn-dependent transcriptional regulator